MQQFSADATSALRAGNPALAESLAAAAVKKTPNDFNAFFVLGVARFQLGKFKDAVDAMQAAVRLNGSVSPAWINLGSMQLAIGQKVEALASFERALALTPPQAELLCNCGNVLVELGRAAEALRRFDAALALKPHLLPALIGRANALMVLHQFAGALADCDRVAALAAHNPAILNVRAACLLGLLRFGEALEYAERALVVSPGSVGPLSNKASALLGLKRYAEALAICDQALAAEPRHAEALCNRGAALSGLGRYDEALQALDAALAINAHMVEAMVNRVAPLRHRERYEDALAAAERALALGSPGTEMLRSRGIVLSDMGRHEDAMRSFEDAIALDAADSESRFNKAQLLLREGRFEEGLPLYEERKRLTPPFGARTFAQPLWQGQVTIEGMTVFVHAEQGLGDAIMFSRYVARLTDMGARVILGVPRKLLGLFRNFLLDAEIVADDRLPEHFDYHIPMASLPLAFGESVGSIPAPIPYFKAEPARVQRWRAHLGEGGVKIGIAWQGARVSNDAGRSIPLIAFSAIAAVPGVRLISLQKGDGAGQLASVSFPVETPGPDFDAEPGTFLDTAAIMQVCDLVISSDTSVPHLAGAMGRPLWIALRHSPEWRWFLSRDDSPWYPSAVLFRQPKPGDWTSVFSSMAQRLMARSGLHS
jgi:tetratricopeptide (TPR) repeat protein